jgi:hypothetical protein
MDILKCLQINNKSDLTEQHEDESDLPYQVTLFQADYDELSRLRTMVGESLNSSVVDCGASKTVCGECGSIVIPSP